MEKPIYEKALEEWKKRDPYLTDYEGFKKYLEQLEAQITAEQTEAKDSYWERMEYCERKLFDLAVRAVLEKEFGNPPQSWDDFFKVAKRYEELVKWRGYGIEAWWNRGYAQAFGVNVKVTREIARKIWRKVVKHPEWFGDWQTALGAKGYSGSAYWLKWYLTLCVLLGKEQEASEILNNLPEELRYPSEEPPEYVKKHLETQGWKKVYDLCKTCKEQNCDVCDKVP